MKAKLGADHPHTLTSMNNLAIAYRDANQLDLALPLFEETLKLRKGKLGADHPDTLISMSDLAGAYAAAGNLDLALPLSEVAADGMEKRQFRHEFAGRIVPNTIRAYEAARQWELAERWQRKWLGHVKEQAGAESVAAATELESLGWNLLQQQKWNDAESTLRECLAIREKTPGPSGPGSPWQWFNTQSMLGAALLGQKKYADAELLLLNGHEGLQRASERKPNGDTRRADAAMLTNGDAATLTMQKKRVIEAAERLVQLYDAWGKPAEAEKWVARLPAEQMVHVGLQRQFAWPLLWGRPRF
jgi:tetratricopeptide (TPR) repeat protein